MRQPVIAIITAVPVLTAAVLPLALLLSAIAGVLVLARRPYRVHRLDVTDLGHLRRVGS